MIKYKLDKVSSMIFFINTFSSGLEHLTGYNVSKALLEFY